MIATKLTLQTSQAREVQYQLVSSKGNIDSFYLLNESGYRIGEAALLYDSERAEYHFDSVEIYPFYQGFGYGKPIYLEALRHSVRGGCPYFYFFR